MTTEQAKQLKYGSRVYYCGTPAIVKRVQRNGVVVSYDGMGLKAGQYVTERVSAACLEPREGNAYS